MSGQADGQRDRMRWLNQQQFGWVPILVVCSGILSLLLMGQESPRSNAKAVEGESFLLKDSAGKLRAELSTRGDDSPKLWFYGEGGERRIELSMLADGIPGLRFLDHQERIRATLGIFDNEASLSLRDPQGHERIKLTLLANGEPSLFLWDKDGRAIWAAPMLAKPEQ
jgi:hypothetical protein